MGHNSFLKLFHEWTTDFLNKNNENIWIIRSRSPKKIWCLCMQILVRINIALMKKKKIFCQNNSHAPVANKITASHKKWCAHSETVFNGNSKREFCCFLVYEKNLLFGIMVFWVGGKNLHHEKWKLHHISQITMC